MKKFLFLILFLPSFLFASDLTKYKVIVCQEKDGSQSELKFYCYQNNDYSIHFENGSNKLYEIYRMKVDRNRFFTVGVSSEKTFASLDKMIKFYISNSHFYVEWQLRSGRACKKKYQIIHRKDGIMYCRHKESFFPKPSGSYRYWR